MKKLVCVLLSVVLSFTLLLSSACAESEREEPGVTVYFPNWNIYSDSRNDVNGLPWDRLD